MESNPNRRQFLRTSASACVLCLGASHVCTAQAQAMAPALVSPGCRTSKVRVGKVYLGIPGALWPTPELDLNAEIQPNDG